MLNPIENVGKEPKGAVSINTTDADKAKNSGKDYATVIDEKTPAPAVNPIK